MSEPPPLLAVDTNVVLRLLLEDEPVLTSKATAIWEAVAKGRLTLLWDPVILAEVVHVLSSIYRLPNPTISEGILPLMTLPGVIMPNKELYVQALKLFVREVPHFGDACLCAVALEGAEGHIVSFDRKLSKAPGITRIEDLPDEESPERAG